MTNSNLLVPSYKNDDNTINIRVIHSYLTSSRSVATLSTENHNSPFHGRILTKLGRNPSLIS